MSDNSNSRKCRFCATSVHKNSLKRHIDQCVNNPDRKDRLCSLCGSIFRSVDIIVRHTAICKRDHEIQELKAKVTALQQELSVAHSTINELRGEARLRSLDWDPANFE